MAIIRIRYFNTTETDTEIIKKCKVGFFDRRHKDNTKWVDGAEITDKLTHKTRLQMW